MITKILIVDDHSIVRSGMSLLLEKKFKNVFIIGVKDFREALSACAMLIFDLVILDINLPDGRECHMIDDLRELQKNLKVLIFSVHDEDIYAVSYIKAGANGYLNKFNDSDSIIKTIKTVLQ